MNQPTFLNSVTFIERSCIWSLMIIHFLKRGRTGKQNLKDWEIEWARHNKWGIPLCSGWVCLICPSNFDSQNYFPAYLYILFRPPSWNSSSRPFQNAKGPRNRTRPVVLQECPWTFALRESQNASRNPGRDCAQMIFHLWNIPLQAGSTRNEGLENRCKMN